MACKNLQKYNIMFLLLKLVKKRNFSRVTLNKNVLKVMESEQNDINYRIQVLLCLQEGEGLVRSIEILWQRAPT